MPKGSKDSSGSGSGSDGGAWDHHHHHHHHSPYLNISRENSRSWTETTESESNTSSSDSLSTQAALMRRQRRGHDDDDGAEEEPSHHPTAGASHHRYHDERRSPPHSHSHGHVFVDDADDEQESTTDDSIGYEDSVSTTSSCIMHNYTQDEENQGGGHTAMMARTSPFDLSSSSHSRSASAAVAGTSLQPPKDTRPAEPGGRGSGHRKKGKNKNKDHNSSISSQKPMGSPDAVVDADDEVLLRHPSRVKLDPDEYLVRHWNAADGPIDFRSDYDWGHWNDVHNNGNGGTTTTTASGAGLAGGSRRHSSSRASLCFSDSDAPVAPSASASAAAAADEWLPFEKDEEACEQALLAEREAAYHYEHMGLDDVDVLDATPPMSRRAGEQHHGSSSSSSPRFPRTCMSFPPLEKWEDTAAVLLSPVERVSQLHQRRARGSAVSSIDGRVLHYNHRPHDGDGQRQTSFSKTRRKRPPGSRGDDYERGGEYRGGSGSSPPCSSRIGATWTACKSAASSLRNRRLGKLFLGAMIFALSSLAILVGPSPRSSGSFRFDVEDVALDLPAATTFRNEVAEKLGRKGGGGEGAGAGEGRRRPVETPANRVEDPAPPLSPPPPPPPRLRAGTENRFAVFLTPSSSRSGTLSDRGRMDLALNSVDAHSSCPQVERVDVSWPKDDAEDDDAEASSNFFGRLVDHGGGKVKVSTQAMGRNVVKLLSLGSMADDVPLGGKTSAVLLLADDVVLTCEEMERAYQIWKQNPDRMVGFYGYRHIPGPGASHGGTDGYSIVSDRAAFVHRDLLSKLAENVGGDNDGLGTELNGSPCEDVELSVRITALTSRPPIVVAGHPLELRSELEADGDGDGRLSGLDSTGWDRSGESCLSALMRELGQDDLPLEERMYIGPTAK